MVGIPKNFTEDIRSARSAKLTKLRYRLLADGTILDQNNNKVAGYITRKHELEEVWNMKGRERQNYLQKLCNAS